MQCIDHTVSVDSPPSTQAAVMDLLLVEDEVQLRNSLREILQLQGFQVETAESAGRPYGCCNKIPYR